VRVRNRWGSFRVVRLVIISTVIVWILFYIPVIFHTGIVDGVCVFKPSLYRKFNTYVFTPIVYGLGPAAVLICSTLGTVRNLHLNAVHTTHERLEKQVRAMLMPQLIILAISGLPFGFQNVYLDITSDITKDASRLALENFIAQVILIFFHFNYAFTFYIYVYKSSEIRKALKKQFFRCTRMGRVIPLEIKTDKSINLRTLYRPHVT
jgi:hypothetical protein